MKGFKFGKASDVKIIILAKDSTLDKEEIKNTFIDPMLLKLGLSIENFLVVGLPFKECGKRPLTGKERDAFIKDLARLVGKTQCKMIMLADAKYKSLLSRKFKDINKTKLVVDNKAKTLGVVNTCLIEGFEGISFTRLPSVNAMQYDPAQKAVIDHCLSVVINHLKGRKASEISRDNIISLEELKALDFNHKHIACDIEGFSLDFSKARLGSIAFAFNENEGYAIDIEHSGNNSQEQVAEIKACLKQIFINARKANGDIAFVFHNITYDVPVLIFELFMDRDINNYAGLLEGLDVFKYSLCSKLALFLSTNNTTKNTLDLKTAVMPFLGSYDVDVMDIRKIASKELLEYNSKDVRGVMWLLPRCFKAMSKDNQIKLHDELMRPSLLVYCKMALTGMAIDINQVRTVKPQLKKRAWYTTLQLKEMPDIKQAEALIKQEAFEKYKEELDKQIKEKQETIKEMYSEIYSVPANADSLLDLVTVKWLSKQIKLDDETIKANRLDSRIIESTKESRTNKMRLRLHRRNYDALVNKRNNASINNIAHIPFNVNSGNHLRKLIYGVMKAPILMETDSGLPSTKNSVLKRLMNILTEDKAKVLDKIGDLLKITKTLNTFIKALEEKSIQHSESHYIHAGINPQGTLSGRPSSSNPNLLNMPSGGEIGKIIKSCFKVPKGWVMCCADFGALESRCDAIVTQDPAKRKVYVENYDGHCLNAFNYFRHEFPEDMEDTAESVNSIETDYPEIRQKAKAPYFLLIYGGGVETLTQLGFSEEEASTIKRNHLELYKASEEHSLKVLETCSEQGYYDVAFGLRIRTPELKGVNVRRLNGKQSSAGRTINNAKTQSYSLLLNRATLAMEDKIKKEGYQNDIRIMNTIYDAVYYLVREDSKILSWLNNNLIEEMEWQELDSLKDPEIPMTSKLEIGYSWDKLKAIPNKCAIDLIEETLEELK